MFCLFHFAIAVLSPILAFAFNVGLFQTHLMSGGYCYCNCVIDSTGEITPSLPVSLCFKYHLGYFSLLFWMGQFHHCVEQHAVGQILIVLLLHISNVFVLPPYMCLLCGSAKIVKHNVPKKWAPNSSLQMGYLQNIAIYKVFEFWVSFFWMVEAPFLVGGTHVCV